MGVYCVPRLTYSLVAVPSEVHLAVYLQPATPRGIPEKPIYPVPALLKVQKVTVVFAKAGRAFMIK